jgi:hypothetical protein
MLLAIGNPHSHRFAMYLTPACVVALVSLSGWGCAARIDPSELRLYDGVYTLGGPGPPDRGSLSGTLTLANGGYVLDTSLGKCKRQELVVKQPKFDSIERDTIFPWTRLRCGDLNMQLLLRHGEMPSTGVGYYSVETRVSRGAVCTILPTDSLARARGDCGRSREDVETLLSGRSYGIRIVRRN